MKFTLRRLSSILFILAVVIYFSFSYYRKTKTRRIIETTLASRHWKERLHEFESEPRTTGRIVFLGNSLTELFDLSILGDSTIINRGITGDFTEGVKQRIGEIISLHPAGLFIEIGINDVVERVSVKEITRNYRFIVSQIQEKSPETRIFIQGLLPVKMKDSRLTSTADVNEVVREENAALKALAKERNVPFIDLYDQFAEHGEINPRLTRDGIHLVDEGYAIWEKQLLPYLKDSSENEKE